MTSSSQGWPLRSASSRASSPARASAARVCRSVTGQPAPGRQTWIAPPTSRVSEGRLRRRCRPAGHGPVGDPEHAAVPRTGQAAVRELALGQRAGRVAAPVGQDMHGAVGPDRPRPGSRRACGAPVFPRADRPRPTGGASRARPGAAPASAWLAPPASRNEMCPPASPLRRDDGQAGQPQGAAQPAGRGPAATPRTGPSPPGCPSRAPRRRASAARAARTSRPRLPPRPGPRPSDRRRPAAAPPSGSPPDRSRMLADSQVPTRSLDQQRGATGARARRRAARHVPFPAGSAGRHAGPRRPACPGGSPARDAKSAACGPRLPPAGLVKPARLALGGRTHGGRSENILFLPNGRWCYGPGPSGFAALGIGQQGVSTRGGACTPVDLSARPPHAAADGTARWPGAAVAAAFAAAVESGRLNLPARQRADPGALGRPGQPGR